MLVPLTVKFPVTVKLSLTVTSEVECPIDMGTPDVDVPIVIPFDVLVLSIANVDVALKSIAVPSTVSVPSISVLSKLVVPAISASPDKSKVAPSNSPVMVKFLIPV